jgi:hypothetical protein
MLSPFPERAVYSAPRSAWLLPVLLFLAVGVVGYLLPATAYFSAVPGDLGDARFNSVVLEHLFQWVTGVVPELWSPAFFFPYEHVLAFSDNLFGSGWVYSVLRLAGLSRELAFDGWYMIGFVLNYLVMVCVLLRLRFNGLATALGAFVFTFALPVLAQDGHAQLVYRWAIPLAFLALWRFLNQGKLVPLGFCAVWVAVQFFHSIYLGVFLVYLLGFTTLAYIFSVGWGQWWPTLMVQIRRTQRAQRGLILLLITTSILAVLALLATYHSVSSDYGFVKTRHEVMTLLPRPGSYLIADRGLGISAWLGHWIDTIPMRHEHQLFFGVGLWGLLGYALWFRIWPQKLSLLVQTCLIAGFGLILFSLCVGNYSFYALITMVPGGTSIRAVTRLVLVLLVPVSLLVASAGQGLDLAGNGGGLRRCVVPAVLIGLIFWEVVGFQTVSTPVSTWQERQNELAQRLPVPLADDALLYVTPRSGENGFLAEIDAMIFAQDHRIATLNGYSGNVPPGYLLPDPCYPAQARLIGYCRHRGLDLSAVSEWAERIVQVDFSPCSHAPVEMSGQLVSTEQAAKIILSLTSISVDGLQWRAAVNITNNSSSDLTPLTIDGVPLRLSWRLIPRADLPQTGLQSGWDPRQDLHGSVLAGENLEVEIADIAAGPGDFELQVSLVQEGVAWLHDLGMSPAARAVSFRTQ